MLEGFSLTGSEAPPWTQMLQDQGAVSLPPAPAPAAPQSGAVQAAQQAFDALQRGKDALTQSFGRSAERAQAGLEARRPIYAGMKETLEQPMPEVPVPPTMPEPPSLGLRPFLDDTPGEPWDQTLQRAVTGLGLLASMSAGAFGGFPQGALAALTGAMQGWQAGDREAADRQFADYQAQVKHLQQEFERKRQYYADVLQGRQATLANYETALKMAAAEQGDYEMIEAINRGGLQAALQLDLAAHNMILETTSDAEKLAVNAAIARMKQEFDVQKFLAEYQQKERDLAIKEAGEERRQRFDALTEQLLEPHMRPGGALSGEPGAGGGTYDPPGLSIGREGPRVELKPRTIPEQAQGKLQAYDSILAATQDLRDHFTDEEITAYAGIVQRGLKNVQQFAGSLPGMGFLSDEKFARFKALTGRLTGTAFQEGGKQLTPFEWAVVASYTPTGSEPGGAAEFRAKLNQLEQYTRLRRALTAHYSQRGIDPGQIPAAVWDQEIRQRMQAAGLAAPSAPAAPAGQPATGGVERWERDPQTGQLRRAK